jgi:hypothetical protein
LLSFPTSDDGQRDPRSYRQGVGSSSEQHSQGQRPTGRRHWGV